jgi:hypothetical protein
MIDANPCLDVERIAVKASDDFNILSPMELEAVVRECGSAAVRREVAVLSVAFYAGLRLGEVRELRWGDVDGAKRMVYVRANASAGQRSTTKGGRVRAVPLVDELARRLDELSKREHWTDDDDHVFATDGGARIDDKDARAYFYDALAAAGLSQLRADVDKHGDPQKPIVFHDLRHSYCSWAVDVWPIPDVQVFAGHRDISTTMKSSTARRRPRTHRWPTKRCVGCSRRLRPTRTSSSGPQGLDELQDVVAHEASVASDLHAGQVAGSRPGVDGRHGHAVEQLPDLLGGHERREFNRPCHQHPALPLEGGPRRAIRTPTRRQPRATLHTKPPGHPEQPRSCPAVDTTSPIPRHARRPGATPLTHIELPQS